MGKIAALRADKAVSKNLRLVAGPTHISEIERLAGALERAAIVLRATPRYADCDEIVAGRQAFYDECLADMKRALENA